METEKFDFEAFRKEALEQIKAGQGLHGTQGALISLIKSLLEEAIKGELEGQVLDASTDRPTNQRIRRHPDCLCR